MKPIRLRPYLVFALLIVGSTNTIAIGPTSYTIFDGKGASDGSILVVARTPSQLFQYANTFIAQKGGRVQTLLTTNGTEYSLSNANIISANFTPRTSPVLLGDVDGDGSSDVLVQGVETGDESLIVTMASGNAQFSQSIGTQYSSNDDYQLAFNDANNDGRDDIDVYMDGIYVKTLLADEDGLYPSGVEEEDLDDTMSTISRTWSIMSDFMAQGNINQMLNYVNPRKREKFQAIFSGIQADLPELASSFGNLELDFMGRETALYQLSVTQENGETTVGSVTFVRLANGACRIDDL